MRRVQSREKPHLAWRSNPKNYDGCGYTVDEDARLEFIFLTEYKESLVFSGIESCKRRCSRAAIAVQ
jgi:hypothetical protein